MVSINCEFIKEKLWYQASQIIDLLGFESINTSTYIKTHIPEENRLQLDGRNTWFVDSYGVAIILMQGQSVLSLDVQDMARQFIADRINTFCDEHLGYELIINADPNKKFNDNFPTEDDSVLNLVS